MTKFSTKNVSAIIFLIIISAVLYTLTIRGSAGNITDEKLKQEENPTQAFELSPERGRFAHVFALADDHTYTLDQNEADFVYPDVGYWNGKFYSFFAPGIAYMAVPFYLIGHHFNLSQVGTFSMISVFAILALIFLFRISRDIFKLPVWASMATVLVFGFGCTSWSYAITLYQHLPTAFFILSSFYAIWRYKNGGSWAWALFVWINYALAISIDYPNAFIMLPVMVYLLLATFSWAETEKGIKISFRIASVLTMIGFVVITGLHLYHNQTYFGSWSRLSGSLPSYKGIVENNLFGSSDPAQAIAATQQNVVNFFSEVNLIHGFHVLTTSRDRGILFYGPIFILALFGIWELRKKLNLEYMILIFTVIANLFLYSSWGDPWGGWAYGSRYLIPSMAVLSLFVGYFLAQAKFSWVRKLSFLILFAYSCAIAILGALTTNAVPPKVEADTLHAPYGYLFNWRLFVSQNRSGSFFYNTFVTGHLSLMDYGMLIFSALLIIMLILLFIVPLYEDAD